MASVFLNISTYKVFLYGGPKGNSGAAANISLGVKDAYVFLRFYPDGVALPANREGINKPSGWPMYYVSYAYDQLGNAIDLLRNEKPMSFYWNDKTGAGYITTANEPVGEGDF